MGREFIGECPGTGDDPESDHLETELAIKYIKQACGGPPRGVDVEVTTQDHELGSYPVISVVWDDSITDYPNEYIGQSTRMLPCKELRFEMANGTSSCYLSGLSERGL